MRKLTTLNPIAIPTGRFAAVALACSLVAALSSPAVAVATSQVTPTSQVTLPPPPVPTSTDAPPLEPVKLANPSGLAPGVNATVPVNNPVAVMPTAQVPARATAVVSTTSSRTAVKRTTRRRAAASTRKAKVGVSQPPAAQLATKKVPRVLIEQSKNGEVIVAHEKKP